MIHMQHTGQHGNAVCGRDENERVVVVNVGSDGDTSNGKWYLDDVSMTSEPPTEVVAYA